MTILAETRSTDVTVSDRQQQPDLHRELALVQNHLVIATFPGDQMSAAFDLARVLCRALAQPVDLFRLCGAGAGDVRAGAIATTQESWWTHLAQVRPSSRSDVVVEICDPALRPDVGP